MSGLFKINWHNVISALMTVVITAVLSVLLYILSLGSIFKIDWHAMTDIGVLSAITGLVSILKALLTDSCGKLLGLIQVNPPDPSKQQQG